MFKVVLFFLVALSPLSAQAYVGPGLGAGAIASILGILLAFIMLLVGVVWYPLKRFLKRKKV